MSLADTNPQQPATPVRLGILFVHGIGDQRPGHTLTNFGEPLYAWIDRWVRGATNGSSAYGFSPQIRTAATSQEPEYWEATLAIPRISARNSHDITFHVTAAECWWASTFAVPTFARVAKWTERFMFRASRLLRLHAAGLWLRVQPDVAEVDDLANIATPYGQRMGEPMAWLILIPKTFAMIVVYVSWALLLFVLPLLLAAVLVLLRAVILITRPVHGVWRRLPVSLVRTLASLFTKYIGDAEALVSGAGRPEMTGRIQRDLIFLSRRVDRVVVVAHSQGARLAYEVLVDTPINALTALVTVGGAVHLLDDKGSEGMDVRLQRFSARHPSAHWHNFWATLDPVPAGPLSIKPLYGLTEREVVNHNSVWMDHTTYFNNLDEVVAPLAEVVASAAGASLKLGGEDSRILRAAAEHRRRRVHKWAACRWQIAPLMFLFALLWPLFFEEYRAVALSTAAVILLASLWWAAKKAWSAWNADCARRVSQGDLRFDQSRAARLLTGLYVTALTAGCLMIGIPLMVLPPVAIAAVGLYVYFLETFSTLNTNSARQMVIDPGPPCPEPSTLDDLGIDGGGAVTPQRQFWTALRGDMPELFAAAKRARRPIFFADRTPLPWVSAEQRARIDSRLSEGAVQAVATQTVASSGGDGFRSAVMNAANGDECRALRWADVCARGDDLASRGRPELRAWLQGATLSATEVRSAARALQAAGREAAQSASDLWSNEFALPAFLHAALPQRKKPVLAALKELEDVPGRPGFGEVTIL